MAVCTSLSPRPLKLTTTLVPSASVGHKSSRKASACAVSRAGIRPSSFEVRSKAACEESAVKSSQTTAKCSKEPPGRVAELDLKFGIAILKRIAELVPEVVCGNFKVLYFMLTAGSITSQCQERPRSQKATSFCNGTCLSAQTQNPQPGQQSLRSRSAALTV